MPSASRSSATSWVGTDQTNHQKPAPMPAAASARTAAMPVRNPRSQPDGDRRRVGAARPSGFGFATGSRSDIGPDHSDKFGLLAA